MFLCRVTSRTGSSAQPRTALPALGFLLVLGLPLAHGCAESAHLTSISCNSDDDCPDGVCENRACVSENIDVGFIADLGDFSALDVQDLRIDPIPDSADSSAGGGFGALCTRDDDCESGYCIDTDDGRFCTALCSETCPNGFTCRLFVNAGGDAVRICVPNAEVLCAPCTNHTDCGGNQAFCVEQDNGEFCATTCAGASECPGGYFCNPVTIPGVGSDGEDVNTSVCEPARGICQPIALANSRFTATSATTRSDNFTLLGRVLLAPHQLESESFTLAGGF